MTLVAGLKVFKMPAQQQAVNVSGHCNRQSEKNEKYD